MTGLVEVYLRSPLARLRLSPSGRPPATSLVRATPPLPLPLPPPSSRFVAPPIVYHSTRAQLRLWSESGRLDSTTSLRRDTAPPHLVQDFSSVSFDLTRPFTDTRYTLSPRLARVGVDQGFGILDQAATSCGRSEPSIVRLLFFPSERRRAAVPEKQRRAPLRRFLFLPFTAGKRKTTCPGPAPRPCAHQANTRRTVGLDRARQDSDRPIDRKRSQREP